MRPGAMWFIKDPQDQNSHPIRDILDRPTLVQLRKILVSAFMYALVVVCVVGSVAGLLLVGSKSVLPLRWKNRLVSVTSRCLFLTDTYRREPLSNVPVDLIFLHLVWPYTMHYFRPVKGLRKISLWLWKHLAAQLRLTSYMFGDRHPSEEFTATHWSWRLFSNQDMADMDHPHDGTFRRVPATDNIALPRDMRATAEVTPDGEPVDDDARQLIEVQNSEAEKAKRVVKDDYTIVYIPPRFRQRIISFMGALWCAGAVVIALVIAVPIQLGRTFFKIFLEREVHDGYSFITGFYLLWTCFVVGKAIDRMDKRRQRRGLEGPRAELWFYAVKRGLLWLAKISYMMVFLGVVIPILVAVVMELYLVLPIRYTVDSNATPRIRVVDMWCLGILYSKIALHVTRLQPPSRVTLGIRTVCVLPLLRV
jgi:E3 ubiquitin-protein ligase MARCH6